MSAFGVMVNAVGDTLKSWSPQLRALAARILKLEQNSYVDKNNFLEEIETNKRWFEKKVFRKVVNIGALPNATTKDVAHNVVGLNQVVSIRGMAQSGGTWIPLPLASGLANQSIHIFATTTLIRVNTQVNWSAYSGWAVLEYTKAGF